MCDVPSYVSNARDFIEQKAVKACESPPSLGGEEHLQSAGGATLVGKKGPPHLDHRPGPESD